MKSSLVETMLWSEIHIVYISHCSICQGNEKTQKQKLNEIRSSFSPFMAKFYTIHIKYKLFIFHSYGLMILLLFCCFQSIFSLTRVRTFRWICGIFVAYRRKATNEHFYYFILFFCARWRFCSHWKWDKTIVSFLSFK